VRATALTAGNRGVPIAGTTNQSDRFFHGDRVGRYGVGHSVKPCPRPSTQTHASYTAGPQPQRRCRVHRESLSATDCGRCPSERRTVAPVRLITLRDCGLRSRRPSFPWLAAHVDIDAHGGPPSVGAFENIDPHHGDSYGVESNLRTKVSTSGLPTSFQRNKRRKSTRTCVLNLTRWSG